MRWQQRSRQGEPLANLTPGPKEPLHRVLPEEIDPIVTLAQSQEYVDLSHRLLAVTAWDQGRFQASFSTVYRVLKARNPMTARGPCRPHNGHSQPPVRKDLTGPNPRWCGDISYLPTFQKGESVAAFALLYQLSLEAGTVRVSILREADALQDTVTVLTKWTGEVNSPPNRWLKATPCLPKLLRFRWRGVGRQPRSNFG